MLRLLALVVTVALATSQSISPASAEAVLKSDPAGDAPARMDITQVLYRNAPHRAQVRLSVPHLVRGGSAELFVAAAGGTDVAVTARVRVQGNGSLRKRLILRTNTYDLDIPCGFGATWNAARNFIAISVPKSCSDVIPDNGPLYLFARTGMDKDSAPTAYHLAEG